MPHAARRVGDGEAVREVQVRYKPGRSKLADFGPALRQPADLARLFRAVIDCEAEPRECFVAFYLDGRHQVFAWRLVSIGTATGSLVHPRELFQAAIGLGAVAIVCAHNHPSGNPSLSAEDRSCYERFAKAGELLGIKCLDLLAVTADAYASAAEAC